MKILLFVFAATVLEALGDAVVRVALHHSSSLTRIVLFFLGAALLTSYGTLLNLAPVDFATVTGVYMAALFVSFQIANYIFFQALPRPAVLVGGLLIVTGGFVIFLVR